MFGLISFVLWLGISAVILSVLPLVKSKGFAPCFSVALVMTVAGRILAYFAFPAYVAAIFLAFIPILGWLMLPVVILAIGWFINTVALYIADQLIEDFEIKTFADTAITALFLSIGQTVISMGLRFIL